MAVELRGCEFTQNFVTMGVGGALITAFVADVMIQDSVFSGLTALDMR